MSKNQQPAIVLVNPQMGENIGAAARAMLNFGLTDLRLVNPRDGWPNERALAMSSGALDKMPPVQVFDSVEEALADTHYVLATTARSRELFKDILTPEQAAQTIKTRSATGEKAAFLFGSERTGLTNEDLSYAHSIITIPCNPDFSSFNLAQAVLLLGYEYAKQQVGEPVQEEEDQRANQEEVNAMLDRLESELEHHGFFRSPELRPSVTNTIRNLFRRADLYEQEVRTLHGIISALIGNKKKDQ